MIFGGDFVDPDFAFWMNCDFVDPDFAFWMNCYFRPF